MATFKIILYQQKTLKDGTHPVMLQCVHNRKAFRISLKYKCMPHQWDTNSGRFKRNMDGAKIKNRVLLATLTKAEKTQDVIRQKNLSFTSGTFRELFQGKKQEKEKIESLFPLFDLLIHELKSKGKVGNMQVYNDTANALKRFWQKAELPLTAINYSFLKALESFLIKGGCTGGGASVYMRTLRAAINEAIKRGYLEKSEYPFKSQLNSNGYSISHLKSAVTPKALSIGEMDRFKQFNTEKHPSLKIAHQLFLFSYHARGMNFSDIAYLKWENLIDGRIQYTRKKTNTYFNIGLSSNLTQILNQFGDQDQSFIFPILSEYHQTPIQQKNRIKKCSKQVNAALREIADIIGINPNITFYWARHTFASTLLKNKVEVAKISQGLGHKDLAVTKAYLNKFEDSELDQIDKFL